MELSMEPTPRPASGPCYYRELRAKKAKGKALWKRRRNGQANSVSSRPNCRSQPAGFAASDIEIANACTRDRARHAAVDGRSANLAHRSAPHQYDKPARKRNGGGQVYPGCS